MDDWLGLAKTLAPNIDAPIAQDGTGAFAQAVVIALQSALKTKDFDNAKTSIDTEPEMKAAAVASLTSLVGSLPEKTTMLPAEDPQATIAALQAELFKLNEARAGYLALQGSNVKYAWVNPLLSVVITGGFIVLVYIVAFLPVNTANSNVFNIILGAFATAFATVMSFHFGSSIGSKAKDQDNRQRMIEQGAARDDAAVIKVLGGSPHGATS